MTDEELKMLALAERMMDNGEIPFVWSVTPYGDCARLAVNPIIMERLGLEQGQRVNGIIVQAIAEQSLDLINEEIARRKEQNIEDQLTDDFDFRKELDK